MLTSSVSFRRNPATWDLFSGPLDTCQANESGVTQHTVQLSDLPSRARLSLLSYLERSPAENDASSQELLASINAKLDNTKEDEEWTPSHLDWFHNTWTEEDSVHVYWRALQDVERLCYPTTPLEEKLHTLDWVLADPAEDALTLSFVNCIRVVGTSPLSPTPYLGVVDVEATRDFIRANAGRWLRESITRYPDWVQKLVFGNPHWIAAELIKNPQWINEQIKKRSATVQGDFFSPANAAAVQEAS